MSSATSSAATLQIWDNAAFDPTITPLQPNNLNPDVEPAKENQMPLNLDAEIAAIESEIAGLSKHLHSLLLLKQSQLKETNKIAVPSKFFNLQNPNNKPKNQDLLRLRRRGMSIDSSEILPQGIATVGPKNAASVKGSGSARPKTPFTEIPRRGMSIGPLEIYSSRITELRNGIATVGPKAARKIGGLGSGFVTPRTLFAAEEKKRSKGRVVASRYSLPSGTKKNGEEKGVVVRGGSGPHRRPAIV